VVTAHLAGRRSTDGLNRLDRMLVVALGLALPPHFRARQRAEWAADLADLARVGRSAARWRYLLAAAWTLPTLRALARHAEVDGPHAVSPPALPTTRMLAWVLVANIGWTVLSWLVVIAGPYLALDVPARRAAGIDSDPKGMWPTGDPSLPSPLRVSLELGGYAATGMDLLLVPAVVVVTVGFLLLSRGQTGQDRLQTLARGALIGVAAFALTSVDLFASLATTINGLALSVTGLTAAGLAVVGFGLPRRWRVVLGLLAAAGLAVALTDNTFGSTMVVWFRD
jgi:hypothetical protein